jgi:hypothetical protein
MYKAFINCRFTHWRGEMLKSAVGFPRAPGFIEITNCLFDDGNASAMNFSFSHDINGCVFSNLFMAMEFYEAYMTRPAFFENSIITNVQSPIVIVGALTNHPQPSYTIRGDSISTGHYGVFLNPARNVIIVSNSFASVGTGVLLGGAGRQGTDHNANIFIHDNTFANDGQAILVSGGGSSYTENLMVNSNLSFNVKDFADGWGRGTNLEFYGNVAVGASCGLDSTRLIGQWYLDDLSNTFPYYHNVDFFGKTNLITYARGSRQYLWVSTPKSIWRIDDNYPDRIPPGAQLIIENYANGQTFANPLYLSAGRADPPIRMRVGSAITARWTNGGWQLFSSLEPSSKAPIQR